MTHENQIKEEGHTVEMLENQRLVSQKLQLLGGSVEEECHLSSFGLVLDILCGADLGLDVLEVRQWLVDDAKLLGCGCG